MSHPGLPREIGTAVIGGGIVGLCVAWRLAKEGHDVAVIDDGRQAGSTANAGSLHVQMQSRFIRLYPGMVPAMEAALPLYAASINEWRSLAESVAEPIELSVGGGLMVAETNEQHAFLARKCAREERLGLDVEMLNRSGLDRVAPYLGPAVLGAEICHSEGKINPLLANRAVRRAAVSAGAVCLTGTRVEAIRPERAGYVLSVAGRLSKAGRIVIAAGAGSGALAGMLAIRLPVIAEPLHMNVTGPVTAVIGHLVQHADRMITLKQLASGHIVIGGGWPAGDRGPDHPPAVLMASLTANVGLAAHIVPAVAGLDIIRTWAGVNPTADGLSVLGPVAAHPGLFFAVPGDAGYTLAPLIARLVADVVCGRRPDLPLEPYGVERFAS